MSQKGQTISKQLTYTYGKKSSKIFIRIQKYPAQCKIHNVWYQIKNYKAYKKQNNITCNKEKQQQKQIHNYIGDKSADEKIKMDIVTIFYVSRKQCNA